MRALYIVFHFANTEKKNMLSVHSQPGENLGKVYKNSRARKNPLLGLGFSLIFSRILPNVRFSPGYEGTDKLLYS